MADRTEEWWGARTVGDSLRLSRAYFPGAHRVLIVHMEETPDELERIEEKARWLYAAFYGGAPPLAWGTVAESGRRGWLNVARKALASGPDDPHGIGGTNSGS